MVSLVGTRYCLAHPVEVSRLFGVDVLLGTLLRPRKTLLARAADKLSRRYLPMFGAVGDAYRLSALFELRVARIYEHMAERFEDIVPACQLFKTLQAEEEEHARVMNICLHAVKMSPSIRYVPSVRDPAIRQQMRTLRDVQRRADSMSLDEALRITEEVERGEVNVIFDKLLNQIDRPEAHMLRERLREAGFHADIVPQQIWALRERLAELGLKAA